MCSSLKVSRMRYLAWVAVLSLQLGIFVCGAGIDVCDAADASAQHSTQSLIHSFNQSLSQNELSQSPFQSDRSHSNTPIDTCAAHAAHVFLDQPIFNQAQPDTSIALVTLLASLNLPEIFHLIEQPPKFLHS